MHVLVAIAWLYVVVLMAVAEATSSDGTLLGALVTFVLYGVLPLAIVALPARARRARRRRARRGRSASAASRRSRRRRPCGR